MTELRPYPAYRDSGMEWMGEVPDHWEVLRLGVLLQERREVNGDGEIDEVLSVLRDRGVIPYSQKGNIGNKKSEDTTRYKIVRPDDIVVNSMNVIIGSVGLSRYTGCLSPVYYVLKTRMASDCPRYLEACFRTKRFQRSLVRLGNGILAHRMRIPMELLKCEPLPRPPHEEQAAIVRFLDDADRRIQNYIRAKKRLIDLLEEQKQAIIHQAVTGQIDVRTGQPYPAYNDSGVEWMGEVPEHWEVRRLKSLLGNISDSAGPQGLGDVNLALEHVESWTGKIRLAGQGIVFDSQAKRFRAGDILFGKLRPYLAKVTKPHRDGTCVGEFLVLRPLQPDVHAQYMEILLRSKQVIEVVNSSTFGAKMPRADWTYIGGLSICLPTPFEQTAIARFLKAADRRSSVRRMAVEREIGLLREYRTRLIADVVTGKIDVQQAAVQLPPPTSFASDEEVGLPHDTLEAKHTARLEQGSRNIGRSNR